MALNRQCLSADAIEMVALSIPGAFPVDRPHEGSVIALEPLSPTGTSLAVASPAPEADSVATDQPSGDSPEVAILHSGPVTSAAPTEASQNDGYEIAPQVPTETQKPVSRFEWVRRHLANVKVCATLTIILTILSIAFAIYYGQNSNKRADKGNATSQKEFKLSLWDDCHDRPDMQNLTVCRPVFSENYWSTSSEALYRRDGQRIHDVLRLNLRLTVQAYEKDFLRNACSGQMYSAQCLKAILGIIWGKLREWEPFYEKPIDSIFKNTATFVDTVLEVVVMLGISFTATATLVIIIRIMLPQTTATNPLSIRNLTSVACASLAIPLAMRILGSIKTAPESTNIDSRRTGVWTDPFEKALIFLAIIVMSFMYIELCFKRRRDEEALMESPLPGKSLWVSVIKRDSRKIARIIGKKIKIH
ncbi:uncharacterized protein KY384_005710 [Bacidia gigantensis]|uniref:uncharacterized protein n=1 Tax=Bacidia gigantensis TaxID=2732470 RepID=UPI001D03A82F|nr:uncharacterized protein KY384_005710 [Bacidia gigantensis]KAG8529075.1 hypothetical protein KY384_005710 [Bacidia gigantensis]